MVCEPQPTTDVVKLVLFAMAEVICICKYYKKSCKYVLNSFIVILDHQNMGLDKISKMISMILVEIFEMSYFLVIAD